MSTPVINAIDNVNQASLEGLFASIATNPEARDNLSQSNRNIDKVSTNVPLIEELNASEDAILRILCRREGRDPANFADLGEVAGDVSLIQALSVRQVSTRIITDSNKAHNAISADDRATREMMCNPAGLDATTFADVSDVASDATAMSTIAADAQASRSLASLPLAMQEVVASQTARDEVFASQTAMQQVAASQTATQEVAASQTGMQDVINSPTALDEIVNSQTAMQQVAASQIGMQEVAASQTAMQQVAPSQTAMQEVADSQTAMQEVADSKTAITELLSDSQSVESVISNTLLNSSVAKTEFSNSPFLVELEGSSDNAQNPPTVTNKDHFLIQNTPNFGGAGVDFFDTNLRIRTDATGNQFNKIRNIDVNFVDDNRGVSVDNIFGVR